MKTILSREHRKILETTVAQARFLAESLISLMTWQRDWTLSFIKMQRMHY